MSKRCITSGSSPGIATNQLSCNMCKSLNLNEWYDHFLKKAGLDPYHIGHREKAVTEAAFYAGFASAFELFTEVISGESEEVAMKQMEYISSQLDKFNADGS